MVILNILISIPALFYLTGYSLIRVLANCNSPSPSSIIERVFLRIVLSIAISSLAGLGLAAAGYFSLKVLLVVLYLISSLFFLVSSRKKLSTANKPDRTELLFFIAIIVIAAVLWHNPFSYIFGGWDPGGYVNTGVHIARTGTINYTDQFFAQLPDEMKTTFSHYRSGLYQRFPAFMLDKVEPGKILPQFHHIYPVWTAIFYMLFGLDSVFYLNPLFGLLSVASVYFLGQKVFNKTTGIIAAFLLVLNIVQLWQVKFQTSEIAAQFFILTSLYMLSIFFQNGGRLYGAGWVAAFACALFTRFDMLLYLPIILFGMYMMLLNRRGKELITPGVGLLITTLFFLLYKRYTYLYVPLQNIILSNTMICAAGVMLLAAVIFFFIYRKHHKKISHFFCSSYFRIPVVALLCLVAVYAYFIRPKIDHSFDGGNFAALGWFFTPWGLAMAVAGMTLFFLKLRRSDEVTFFLAVLVSTGIYSYNLLSDDFYMWSARRFAPMVIPGLCLFTGWFIQWPSRRFGIAISIILALAIALPPLVRGRAIISGDDFTGSTEFLAELADELDPEPVYICNGYRAAAPLSLIYGFDLLALSDISSDKIKLCFKYITQQLKHDVLTYYIGPEEEVYSNYCNFRHIKRLTFSSSRIEHSRNTVPDKIRNLTTDYNIFAIEPLGPSNRELPNEAIFDFGENFFGQWSGFELTSRKPEFAIAAKRCSMIIPIVDGAKTKLILRAYSSKEDSFLTVVLGGKSAGTVKIAAVIGEYEMEIPTGFVYTPSKRATLELVPEKGAIVYFDWIKVVNYDRSD
jgi:Dolichyl-phosphate-mannose-protein mannosyltransferase